MPSQVSSFPKTFFQRNQTVQRKATQSKSSLKYNSFTHTKLFKQKYWPVKKILKNNNNTLFEYSGKENNYNFIFSTACICAYSMNPKTIFCGHKAEYTTSKVKFIIKIPRNFWELKRHL